jgi:hypothetical protein
MSKFRELIKSPHIHLALATGISIIAMAFISKRVLAKPMESLPQAIPPFLMVIWESLPRRFKKRRIYTPWYWIVAIVIATALVILFHII